MPEKDPWVKIPFYLREGIKLLTREQQSSLFMAIVEYAFEDKEPDFASDPMLNLAWAFIWPSLEMGED